MVCPVACPLTVSCSPSAMVVNLGVSTAALRLKGEISLCQDWTYFQWVTCCTMFGDGMLLGNLALRKHLILVNGVWQPVYQASTCGFTLEVVGGGLTLTAPYASNCWQLEVILYL